MLQKLRIKFGELAFSEIPHHSFDYRAAMEFIDMEKHFNEILEYALVKYVLRCDSIFQSLISLPP